MRNCRRLVLCIACPFTAVIGLVSAARSDKVATGSVDGYDVVFDTPSKDFRGAVPLGNGDIGISAWVEENGDLLFYIGKTDAFDDSGRLVKLGLVRVRFSPNPFKAVPFRQELRPGDGELDIQTGSGDSMFAARLWVDANRPVIHLETDDKKPREMRVSLESWRTAERKIAEDELTPSDSLSGSSEATVVYPDTILDAGNNRVTWYHHNRHSTWPETLKLQGLESLLSKMADPILDRIFGGTITGRGMIADEAGAIKSSEPRKQQDISIHILTMHPAEPAEWLAALDVDVNKDGTIGFDDARTAHRQWWHDFWDRSWIRVGGPPDAIPTSRGYALQRYLVACGGRGNAAIKFNGSIFTLPWQKDDPDFRRWGPANWFQNTRLLYWPLIAAGDCDMMEPFFKTYRDALSLAGERTELYYGHEGAFFPESMYLGGTYSNRSYGWKREGREPGVVATASICYYWQGGLELSAMMLACYANTQDRQFVENTLLPLVSAVIRFYDKHYPRDEKGELRLVPAHSLETWHESVNPVPEIAGLKCVLTQLLNLPHDLTTDEQREEWKKLLSELPGIPVKTADGKTTLLPAELPGRLVKKQVEDPELYSVFPYGLYGVGREHLDVALATYRSRPNRKGYCWWQNDMFAACLGLAEDARKLVSNRLSSSNRQFRFPAMWGPGNDEIPDMDHGGVGAMALQLMLMQAVGDKILLFPAWPKAWDAEFKLHMPQKTVVEGIYRAGKLEYLKVTPESRTKDVIKLEPQ